MAVLQHLSLALVVVSAIYVTLTAVATWRFARCNPQSAIRNPQFMPPVTVLKPVCGVDAEAEDNFRSFLEQDYPDFQVIFGALDENDPALKVARDVVSRLSVREYGSMEASSTPPHLHTSTPVVVVSANPRTIGANLKVSNLHNMMEHAKYDLLIISDSDMRVTPSYLREVVAPFADEDVGLVTCPYRGVMPREATRWQRFVIALHALGITADFMPSVMVAHMFGMRGFAFGSTIVIRRRVLDGVGGFQALKDHLADDYQLGQRVKRLGRKVVLSRYIVDNVLSPESFAEMFARRLRWARTVKVCQRVGYIGSFVTHLFPLALIYMMQAPNPWLSIGAFTMAGSVRGIAVQKSNAARFGDPVLKAVLWLWPINDWLSFLIWWLSFVPGPFVWRGKTFHLTRHGVLMRFGPGIVVEEHYDTPKK